MKTLRAPLALLLLFGVFARAQDPVPVATAPQEAFAQARRSPEQLEQLLAPIALYPDALLAIILPATTAPADIVLAARYVREFPNDHSQVEHRGWDESVKSLTYYPDVLSWLDQNLDWTKQVGEAFAVQSAEVMQAMQRLRAKARAAGTLVDTPQQQVIAEPDVIRIVPADPNVIYVPYYQPEVVFVDRPSYYSPSYFSFGIGVPVGAWLAFECDWRRNSIWVGNRHRPWTGHDWHQPLFAPVVGGPRYARNLEVRQWRPPTVTSRRVITAPRAYTSEVARPAPIRETFVRPSGPRNAIASESHYAPAPVTANTPSMTQSFATASSSQSPRLRSLPANSTPRLSAAPNTVPSSPAVVSPPPAPSQQAAPAEASTRNRGHRGAVTYANSAPMAQSVGAAMTAPPAQAQSSVVAPPRTTQHYTPPAQAVSRASAPAQPQAASRAPAPTQSRAAAPEAAAPATSTPSAPPASAPPARSDNGNGRGRRGEVN